MSYIYLHECGMPAFRYLPDLLPADGQRVIYSQLQHVYGAPMMPHETRKCDSCDGSIEKFDADRLVEE